MDPFLLIEYNGKHYKTKVYRDKGTEPEWNETVEIPEIQ
jgi:Ca2+-dependent lipid-binding protein